MKKLASLLTELCPPMVKNSLAEYPQAETSLHKCNLAKQQTASPTNGITDKSERRSADVNKHESKRRTLR